MQTTLKEYWDDYDCEPLFDYNYEKFPEFFQTYKDNPIEYVLTPATKDDVCSYRTAIPFDKNKKLKVDLFLGCSHTYGVGHHEKNIWVAKVTEKTGNTPVNLGSPGRGTSKSYANLVNYADLWDVQNIFHFQPYYPRYDSMMLDYTMHHNELHEIWTDHQIDIHGESGIRSAASYGARESYTRDYIETTMATEKYMKYYHNKHIYACAGYAASKGIRYYHRHSEPNHLSTHSLITYKNTGKQYAQAIDSIHEQDFIKTLTLARDGRHLTVEAQQEIGKEFVKMYDTVKNRKRVGGIELLLNHNA